MGYGMAGDGLRARYAPQSGGLYYLFQWDPQGSLVQRQTGGPGGNTSYYALDTAMYDGYGAKLGDMDAFTGGAEPTRDAMGFQGQFGAYTDTETGLVLMGHRYYDAGTGRFLTRDPLGYGGGINLYGFTGNNPVNGMDPDGLAKVELRFKSENSLTGKGPYHTYIVITDNDGSEYYFRGENTVHGGLSPGGSGSSASSGSSSQSSASSNSSRSSRAGLGGSSNGSSNSSNSSSAGSSRGGKGKNNGPWGPLSVEYGAYVPSTPDYIDPANDTRPSKVLVNDNLPASYYYYPMKMRADRLNRANIPYNPLSTNSNSAAGYMLGASGFKAPKNCAGWTPGLYHPLPLK